MLNAESVRVFLDVCNEILQERDELKKELFTLQAEFRGNRGPCTVSHGQTQASNMFSK